MFFNWLTLTVVMVLLEIGLFTDMPCGQVSIYPAEAGDTEMLMIGGKRAEEKMFPWVGFAAHADSDLTFCTVSLIHPKWVLTAAHCIEQLCPDGIYVILGIVKLEKKTEKNVFKVKRICYPSEAMITDDRAEAINDIALIELQRKAPIAPANPNIDIVCLPRESENFRQDNEIFLAGWGMTDEENNAASEELRYILSYKIEESRCNKFTRFCVTAKEPKKKPYHGDSGGPAMIIVNGRYYIQGVLSGGNSNTSFSYYTDIYNYLEWIWNLDKAHTKDNICPKT